MYQVSNYHDFVKARRSLPAPPKRLYGDLLPLIAVGTPREFCGTTQAQSNTVKKQQELKLRTFYFQKRRKIMQMDVESRQIYKEALKRFKLIKIKQREHRMKEKEERQPSKSSSQASFVRKTAVIEASKMTSKSAITFKHGRSRELSIDLPEISLFPDDGASTINEDLLTTTTPISSVASAQLLPPLVPGDKQQSKKQALSPARFSDRIKSMLHPIPEDETAEVSSKFDRPATTPLPLRPSPPRNERKPRKKQKQPPAVELPPLLSKPPPDSIDEKPPKPVRDSEDHMKRLLFNQRYTALPLIPNLTRYTNWELQSDGTYRPKNLTYVKPEMQFFSYEPIIERKKKLEATSLSYNRLVQRKLHNFFADKPLEAPPSALSENNVQVATWLS